MKQIKTAILLSLSLQVAFTSCKKKEESTCTAGSGGNVAIVVYPKHHGKSIRPYTAYARYNSKDAPSAISDYDLKAVADTTALNIKLTNLKCGDYYLFANGYDTSIEAAVKGGIPFTINESASGEINVDVPVTE